MNSSSTRKRVFSGDCVSIVGGTGGGDVAPFMAAQSNWSS